MLHMLAESDDMPPGLKLTSSHNFILYDSTLIAGVIRTTMTKTILLIVLKMKMITIMKMTQICKRMMTIMKMMT